MSRTGVVVITGGSAGVGRATALRFAREGWRVGIVGRDSEALAETASEIAAAGGVAHAARADVARAAELDAAADAIAEALGPIDVWVNNAMTTVFSFVADITPEEYARVTDVCYLGSVHGTMTALHHMRGRGGHIVQVGSALGYRGIPLQAAYCGAKHALRGFLASLRTELIHQNSPVRLSIVQLPAVNTPQFDWARTHMTRTPRPAGGSLFQPEAPAEAIYRTVRKPAREYWLSLETARTIVGDMIAPGLLDGILAKKAVSGQETEEPVSLGRRDNLWDPVTSLHRTRGAFGKKAHARALLIPADAARIAIVAAGALVCAALGAGIALLF